MAKIHDIRALAQQNAQWVSGSPLEWMRYLDVAARLYRYSFSDTLLIHAQRPAATACAELEIWNEKMHRWVNRGAKGIALIDDTSPRPRLRYVFDISDTHLVRGGRTPVLWRIEQEKHERAILGHLTDTYGLQETTDLNAALMELAQQLTEENLDEAMDGLEYEVSDTFLEGLDEDNLRVRFRDLMTSSIFYVLSRRCGQEPMDLLENEDFLRIVDFNRLSVLTFLGNAVSEQCEPVLMDIGREMRKIYKKELTVQLEKSVDSLYNTNTDFSTLKHETDTQTAEGGQSYGTDVSSQGGLSVPEPDDSGRAADDWQVRDVAPDVPERTQEELVSEYADERQVEPVSGADRPGSRGADGDDSGEPEREVPHTGQGNRADGVGGAPEQPDADGRGDRLAGIGVQLTEDTTEQDLNEAEEEIASALSLPELPTVEQQLRAIEAPMRARYAGEISVPAEVVDEILRMGGNRNRSQLRLIYNFMTEQDEEDCTAFVKKEYGVGGKGVVINGTEYSVWFDELGMSIAVGQTAKTLDKAFLSWEDVSGRIHQLLKQGEYAPQTVLDAARDNAVREHAEALAYMEQDMTDEAADIVFDDLSVFNGGFPDKVERLKAEIVKPEYLEKLNIGLENLRDAYAADKSLMRFSFYSPDKVLPRFQKFAAKYLPYQAKEGFAWQEHRIFITQDEVDAFLSGHETYSDSRLAIYSFFLRFEDKKARVDFIKERYGTGGCSPALRGTDASHADYDAKGLTIARGLYGHPDAEIKMKWGKVAERVAYLMERSEYLEPADYSRMPAYEWERMAGRVIEFYSGLPDEIERPFERDFLNESARRELPRILESSERAQELLEKMNDALLSVPVDSESYERRAQILSQIRDYIEGTYTLFPEKKRAVEIEVHEPRQITMFDFMASELQSKERSTAAAVEESENGTAEVESVQEEEAIPEPPALQNLNVEDAEKYDALKEANPDSLVGFEQNGYFEFYGEDAQRVSEILGTNILEKQTEIGAVRVTGFQKGQWAAKAKKLWSKGENVYLTGRQEDGSYYEVKHLRAKDYLPVNAVVNIDGRDFRVDSVNFQTGKVSLQDMELARRRYPLFRDEPVEFVRELYEEQDSSLDYEVEEHIFLAMDAAGVSHDDFSPQQTDVIYDAARRGKEVRSLLNPDFSPEQMQLISDVQERTEAVGRSNMEEALAPLTEKPMTPEEVNRARRQNNLPLETADNQEEPSKFETKTVAVYPGNKNRLPYDVVIETLHIPNQEKAPEPEKRNFRITDDDLGAGGQKTKYKANIEAIRMLQKLESENRFATAEEQEVLSRYVGWGGIPQAFDESNADWSKEYAELRELLPPEEYRAARASTLNAFYTSPTVIKAMYEALGNMGLTKGNVLEPSCGVGNFMGLVPESMEQVKMYGVELDGISGRIAQQLYQKNKIAVQGFETMQFPDSFFDCVVGNAPFGAYKVPDKRYDKYNFLIHDYFIAKSLDLTRPGGVVAVVTSSGTMDKQNPAVREYMASRADLVGAIRLPNNAFLRNANTGVTTDILFLQKCDRAALEKPSWVDLGTTPEGYPINQYFVEHPDMVLGEVTTESTMYGGQDTTVRPIEGAVLAEQLKEAVSKIHATITEQELPDDELGDVVQTIPADPNVKNFSFANVDGKVYYRENSVMNLVELPAVTAERVLGMIALRETTQELLNCQMNDGTDAEVTLLQQKLMRQYKAFTAQYGLISGTANKRAFRQDSSYCLLSSLEILDEEGNLKRTADIFHKRTISKPEPVTSVDTASEALALSIGEKAKVDVPYMAQLTGKTEDEVKEELTGVIFRDPPTQVWQTADEYLSGNVREKLAIAENFAANHEEYAVNVEALRRVQPKDLDASEIEVRLGATWVKPEYVTQFMAEVFNTPRYYVGDEIKASYSEMSGAWNISGKSFDRGNPRVTNTYGTSRVNAYRLLEDALNLRDTKIYDTIHTEDGDKRVLNKQETILAQNAQNMIREAFKSWIFKDLERREDLCATYNKLYNSTRPREYDGSHIRFVGMTPEISLMQHQKNAVAHILYGNNTLLAHCVGAGKTFQMIAAGMESRRLGLAQKCLYVVPNHLTEQWGADFLRLYPNANVLVATKKDFEPANRKKFCSRIATGDYDAIIIGHSQFERIPLSVERQRATIERQIDDIILALEDVPREEKRSFSVKQMEKTKKSLEARLQKLNDQTRKDDVVTFEQLGVDRLFVDESHFYKNMFLYTKMRNVAGIAQTDAQKSSDMFMKCQYLDELTGGKGVTFATGTPVSNSMVELYTIMRYLQYDTLQKLNLGHFDSWAASFGETVTAIELAPEGTGYRAKTRFARFFNLPELISLFKESADVQTSDMLNLPVPKAEYINEVLKPSEIQTDMVQTFAERAERVRNGAVDPRTDNMLKITNDGRKLALDQRLINDMLPDEADSKVNRCVDNAFSVWQETTPQKSTQLIFCDLSTPKADGTFNVYDDVREKLVARGVPMEEVAFIHEADTETKKAALFAKVRAGQVRILLGSTPKLGAGTNIQDRLIALHHLDCPWKPSDLEQQEGRILRQGNQNEKVKIFRYVTENTFDSYMWQILENKQKFISQIMTSKSPVRACDDVDDTALSYAEIKALATGNPFIKEKMDLDIQVSKMKLAKANHVSQIYSLESAIARRFPSEIAAAKERIAGLKADLVVAKLILAQDKEQFSMVVDGKKYTDRKEAGTAIIAACAALKAVKAEGQIGEYQGFALHSKFDSFDQKFKLTIKRQCSYTIEVGKDPFGNIQRITNALAGIEKSLPDVERRLETLQQQLAEAQEEVKRPYEKEAELAEKSARLAELNALLNMDERGGAETLGVDEETAEADKPPVRVKVQEKQAEQEDEPKPKAKSYDIAL